MYTFFGDRVNMKEIETYFYIQIKKNDTHHLFVVYMNPTTVLTLTIHTIHNSLNHFVIKFVKYKFEI